MYHLTTPPGAAQGGTNAGATGPGNQTAPEIRFAPPPHYPPEVYARPHQMPPRRTRLSPVFILGIVVIIAQ